MSGVNPIITVTGTKGKTGIIRALDHIFRELDRHVVRVDTSGAYYDGHLRFSDAQSRELWGYAVTNMPGRFLALHTTVSGVSLLEATLFSARTGLGYKRHDVGIFTNVYDDHIGSFPDIQTRHDIAEMKSFVFSRLKPDGTAIYNADDTNVTDQLSKLSVGASRMAVSLQPGPQLGATYTITDEAGQVILYKGKKVQFTVPRQQFPWVPNSHKPSLYLLLFTIAASYATEPKSIKQAIEILKEYTFDPDGGRMVQLSLKNGGTLLMDYAHEAESLRAIADHAHNLGNGKIWGVIRLAPSRNDKSVQHTAQAIYDSFDGFVVYDKVDGYLRQPKMIKGYRNKPEITGRMATLLSKELRKLGTKPVEKLNREDKAIARAIEHSTAGDVIVYIVGDDPARSRQFVATKLSPGR
jgi:cyanophycin synthetase